jgi:hypothetical protein
MQVTTDPPRSSAHDTAESRQRRSADCDLVLAQRKETSRGQNVELRGSIASISSWLDQRLRNPVPRFAEAPLDVTDTRKRVPPDSLAISRGAVLREAFATAAIDETSGFGPTSRTESRSQAREYSGREGHGQGGSVGQRGRHREAQVQSLNFILTELICLTSHSHASSSHLSSVVQSFSSNSVDIV